MIRLTVSPSRRLGTVRTEFGLFSYTPSGRLEMKCFYWFVVYYKTAWRRMTSDRAHRGPSRWSWPCGPWSVHGPPVCYHTYRNSPFASRCALPHYQIIVPSHLHSPPTCCAWRCSSTRTYLRCTSGPLVHHPTSYFPCTNRPLVHAQFSAGCTSANFRSLCARTGTGRGPLKVPVGVRLISTYFDLEN